MSTKNKSKKTIAVVVVPGVSLLDLVGTYSMLLGLTMNGQYKLSLVGECAVVTDSDTPMQFLVQKTFDEAPRPAMLFVIGGPSAVNDIQNQKMLDYLRTASESAELVGAVDSGSLLLAAAGLLTDKQATTHWAYREQLEAFGAHYIRKAWVEDGKFITAAGVAGGMDMGLHLIEKRINPATARMLQTSAEYDPEPPFGGIDWNQAPGKEQEYQRLFAEPPKYTGEQKQIAFVLYPGLTPLDLVGPLQVISALSRFSPQFKPIVVGERIEPMLADNGLKLVPNKTFEEVPHPYAVIVPGGSTPTLRAMNNQRIRDYLRTAAETAEFIGSVCTGALILASVGLMQGRPATTHWAYYKILESFGSTYQRKRWVENGKVINSAGVSAGIDMALFFASRITDEDTARRVQLAVQYDPQPPLGKIEWDKLSPMLRALRGFWGLAAPFITAKSKRLLAQGR
jgi:transcriptional regulator GlxA family with amidase domain